MAEVQHGQDDDLIEVQAGLALPDATGGEVALARGQTAEPRQQTPFHGIEKLVGKGLTLVVGPGEINRRWFRKGHPDDFSQLQGPARHRGALLVVCPDLVILRARRQRRRPGQRQKIARGVRRAAAVSRIE
jgi:hypothetical protein